MTQPKRDTRSGSSDLGALLLLLLGLAFPVGLMIANPVLMFERGWHQYASTAIYAWGVLILARQWWRGRSEERGLAEAPALLDNIAQGQHIPLDDRRLVPSRLRQLDGHSQGERSPSVGQLMELNREISGLDQERVAGRFTLTRYILYLLPVIGFIGTVEGISEALKEISNVLPQVKDLDAFLGNLTGVTSALQIAFDSTLLALFLSAVLMLLQTLLYRRAEDQLARIDAWVVEHVLPRLASPDSVGTGESVATAILSLKEAWQSELAARLGDGFGPHVERFGAAAAQLTQSMANLEQLVEVMRRSGSGWEHLAEIKDQGRRTAISLAHIEAVLSAGVGPEPGQIEAIGRGIDRANASLENLTEQWTLAYERSNRASQEQLTRTMSGLKEALELLQVSMEQGNALYRSIVRKLYLSHATNGNDSLGDAA